MQYKPQKTNEAKKKRNRKRPVVYWNPPFSANVKTNVGAQFFKLLDSHFPKGHPLHKALNRNTVKMSYRTTPNLKKFISSHNAKILNKSQEDLPCNCTNKEECPLEGKCRAKNIIYQAEVKSEQVPPTVETYVGLTATEFKLRYSNHMTSIRHNKTSTTLSSHIKKLKSEKVKYTLKWKIVGRAQPFSPVTGVCALCTLEKFFIITKPHMATLNRKEEIFNYCLHKRKLLLDKT